MKVRDLAKMIDHSLLHPTMTDNDLRKGCDLAAKYACATVCIKPYEVPLASELLAEADCDICAVAGFLMATVTLPLSSQKQNWRVMKEPLKLILSLILVRS